MIMNKHVVLLILGMLCGSSLLMARNYQVCSPDGKLSLTVFCGEQATWSMSVDGETVSSDNKLGMDLVSGDGVVRRFGNNMKIIRALSGKVRGELSTPLYRQKSIPEEYNSLLLKCRGGFDLELRAYDEGVAYRFVTHLIDSISVLNEYVQFHTGRALSSVIPYQYGKQREDIYECSFENEYEYYGAGVSPRQDKFAFLPM